MKRLFAQVLNDAANKALEDGKITKDDLLFIRRARFHPFVMQVIKKRITEEAVMVNAVGAVNISIEDIDWQTLFDFTVEIMPLIIELVKFVFQLI